MLKSVGLALLLSATAAAVPTPAAAQPSPEQGSAAIDPARQKTADNVALKLVPPGAYQRIMKDMMDAMTGSFMDQMLGMDAATLAAMSGDEKPATGKGKSLQELAAARDPHFRERMDIMMKVMFTEMGAIMGEMEPQVRTALAGIYARKYTLAELNDINAFFNTPSGAAFASNFMSTFTDKEMMEATFSMMPKLMEAMPAIIKKVEAATAHLPPPPSPTIMKTTPADDAANPA